MTRWFVNINGVYYDFYHNITDFGIIHLSLLSTNIENYNGEAQLAIL